MKLDPPGWEEAWEIKARIRANLRDARVACRLTQTEVSRAMGWHRPMVSQFETGVRELAAHELMQLCCIYQVNPWDILRKD